MAYGLKYYWEGTRTNVQGATVRSLLWIYEKDYTGIRRQMGDLCELSVGFDGQNDIAQAITKSTLTFTLVDSRDKAQTPAVANSVKYGAWEEFFTPDATKYKVILMGGPLNYERLRWAGYITPDSWEEDLVYRGQVSITARDNLGHLQDFDFDGDSYGADANGLISLSAIISRVVTLIEQGIVWDDDTAIIKAWYEKPNGVWGDCYIGNVKFDTECFKDKNWYEVLEGVLDSLGLCIRWQDSEDCYILSAIYKVESACYDVQEHGNAPVCFVNRSGHRALNPAYKQIIDDAKFELKAADPDTPKGFVYQSIYLPNAVVHDAYYLDGPVWKTMPSGHSYIRTLDYRQMAILYGGRQEWRTPDTLMIRTASSDNSEYFYRNYLLPGGKSVKFSFEVNKGEYTLLCYYDEEGNPVYSVGFGSNSITVRTMVIWHPYSAQATTSYWSDGGWTPVQNIMEKQVSGAAYGWNESETISYEMATPSDEGYLEVRFYTVRGDDGAKFARIYNITMDAKNSGVVTTDTVTTVYDASQNVTLKRNPMLAQYPEHTSYGAIINTVFSNDAAYGYPAINGWSAWIEGQGLVDFPRLAVMIHKQILCLHCRPMNALSGELMDGTYDNPYFSDIWQWNDQKHYLVGGRLDLLTGRINNAYLQEYLDYDEVWDEE